MRGVVLAWAVGEGIIVYRSARRGVPPLPSALLVTSGLFVALGILGEAAAPLATALAVGVDIAAFLQLFPDTTTSATPAGAAKPATTASHTSQAV